MRLPFSSICFNPRICKRCDPFFDVGLFVDICFNPRICKRCDNVLVNGVNNNVVSIHASVKDATTIQIIL